MIGLMGVGDDGKTLYAPNGKRLFKCHIKYISYLTQRMQHYIADIYNRIFY